MDHDQDDSDLVTSRSLRRPRPTTSGPVASVNSHPFSAENDPHGLLKASHIALLQEAAKQDSADIQKRPQMFAYMLQHISEASLNLLKRDLAAWTVISDSEDPVLLLTRILATHIAPVIGNDTDSTAARQKVRNQYKNLKQAANEEVSRYYERIQNVLKSFDAMGIPRPPDNDLTSDFIEGLDDTRYGGYRSRLHEDLALGQKTYPRTIDEAATQAVDYRPTAGNTAAGKAVFTTQRQADPSEPPAQSTKKANQKNKHKGKGGAKAKDPSNEETTPKTSKKQKAASAPEDPPQPPPRNQKPCTWPCPLGCGGCHYANQCPFIGDAQKLVKSRARKVNVTTTQDADEDIDYGHTIGIFTATTEAVQPADDIRILLDNQAEGHIFKDSTPLDDVVTVSRPIPFNGITPGALTTNKKGRLLGPIDVYTHPQATANILSLSTLRDQGFQVGEDIENDRYYWHLPSVTISQNLISFCFCNGPLCGGMRI
jgi:hypothetical protein